MASWLIIAGFILVLLGAAAVWLVYRRPQPPEDVAPGPPPADDAGRRAREEAASRLGTQLLERRVDLEVRRGPLGGDTRLDAELAELDHLLASGEITEDEYERRKISLLGGQGPPHFR